MEVLVRKLRYPERVVNAAVLLCVFWYHKHFINEVKSLRNRCEVEPHFGLFRVAALNINFDLFLCNTNERTSRNVCRNKLSEHL